MVVSYLVAEVPFHSKIYLEGTLSPVNDARFTLARNERGRATRPGHLNFTYFPCAMMETPFTRVINEVIYCWLTKSSGVTEPTLY